MFKIGEFSKLTQVSIRMLRYYDENDILKPACIDSESGYRLYSIEQISQLQQIVMLRDCRFSTAEIKEARKHWDEHSIVELLTAKKKEIQIEIEQEQQRISRIDTALKDVQENHLDYQYQIQFKTVPSYPVLSLRRKVADYYKESELWQELCNYVMEQRIEVEQGQYNNLSIYHETDEESNEVDIEIAVVVPKLGAAKAPFRFYMTEELPLTAYMMVYGPYERLAKAYEQVAYWLNEHEQYEMYGCSRQISHKGPQECSSSEEYLTEIQIPVRKRK